MRASVPMSIAPYSGAYDQLIARSREWGTGGNRISYKSVLTSEVVASTMGTAIDETLIVAGTTFTIISNGGVANTYTQPASAPADNADLAVDLADNANWSTGTAPTDVVISVSGVDGASIINIERAADVDAYKLGYTRNFEIMGLSTGDAALLGISAGQYNAKDEPTCAITIYNSRDLITEEDTSIGGLAVIKFGRGNGDGATGATVSVNSSQIILDKDGSLEYSFNMSEYNTLKELADNINTLAEWTCEVTSNAYANLSPSVLDEVTDLSCFSAEGNTPAMIKKDAQDVADFFAASILAEIGTASSQLDPTIGLPPARNEVFMSGGARGATSSASILDALVAFEKFHVNSIIPLFSRDAIQDIADGLTDGGSTYTIDAINQATKTHISTMKTTVRRSERQGYISKKTSEADSYDYAQGLADQRLQLAIQDVRSIDAGGNIKWFQPFALSCMLAGARAGSPVGTPLTFKNLNVAGIRHTSQLMTTPDANIVTEFDPDLDATRAIQAGITFLESPTTGGVRVVVDNTTYGRDGNPIYNRGNSMYAADVVAYNLRNSLELQFVGQKNTITAATVASAVEATMANFLGQGIIVSSDDAPNGFKNLTVSINGNVIDVGVVVKLVEGIDFILSDISIQRASSSV